MVPYSKNEIHAIYLNFLLSNTSEYNYNLLQSTFSFLQLIYQFKETTKMGSKGIGTIFAPILFGPLNVSLSEYMEENAKRIDVVKFMLKVFSNYPKRFRKYSAAVQQVYAKKTISLNERFVIIGEELIVFYQNKRIACLYQDGRIFVILAELVAKNFMNKNPWSNTGRHKIILKDSKDRTLGNTKFYSTGALEFSE